MPSVIPLLVGRDEENDVVVLHASAPIQPTARQRWSDVLEALTPPSRAEDACQSYAVYESVETPNTFIFVEGWSSLEGLYAHFHTPHFTAFFAALGDMLADAPRGTIYEVSSTMTLDEALAAAGVGGEARSALVIMKLSARSPSPVTRTTVGPPVPRHSMWIERPLPKSTSPARSG